MTAPFATAWSFPDYCPLCGVVAIQHSAIDFSFEAEYEKSRPAIEDKLESAEDRRRLKRAYTNGYCKAFLGSATPINPYQDDEATAFDNGVKAGAKARADQPKYMKWKQTNQ